MKTTVSLALLTIAMLQPQLVTAHEDDVRDEVSAPVILGILDFPNSGAPAAQDAFDRGVKLLHSFEFDDARSAFLEAQEIDPDFAMAIWGEAMTFNHPLWEEQDRDAALTTLAKLPPADERDTTDREERYLEAVAVLFGQGDKPARDTAYRDAMRQLYEDYPDDLEAAAFYALSILGSVYERDFRTYMLAASIAEEVFAKQPRHPGAAHYLIHSYDDQIHAPLGLRAARVYATIAPSASHAQHMVSHIYTSLGMWDEVVDANIKAVEVSAASLKRSGREPQMRSKHALHWLQYALLQQGRFAEARDTLQLMKQDVFELPNDYNRRHSTLMRATAAVEDIGADRVLPPLGAESQHLVQYAEEAFATAFDALNEDDPAVAARELDELKARIASTEVLTVAEGLHEDNTAVSEDGYLIARIIAREIEALLLFRRGDTQKALQLMASAVADENSRPLYYGPPHVPKPSAELLGEMLLSLHRPDEAAAQFEAALSRNTGRTLSLLGLMRARQQAGGAALNEKAELLANWRGDIDQLLRTEYGWLDAGTDASISKR